MLTPYAEAIPRSFRVVIGARAAHRHNGYRSATGSALYNAIGCSESRPGETVRLDDAGGRALSDHGFISS